MPTAQEPIPADEATREHRALAWAAAAAALAIFWLVRPVALGILVGTLLAFMAQPTCAKLAKRIGARAAVLVTVLSGGLAVGITLGGLGWLLVARGSVLAAELGGAIGPRGLVDGIVDRVGGLAARLGISHEQLGDHLRGLGADAVNAAERIGATIAATTASAMLGLLFAMLAMHFILRTGDALPQQISEVLPLRPAYTTSLVAEFRRVGRATLLGSVVTGVVQGLLAMLGFWILGVPEPMFLGAATTIASFVPAVGVLLVLVPVCAGLAVTDHSTAAVIGAVWGLVFVIGIPDYVIRPRLVRGQAEVPTIVTFAALFGGIEVLGLQGLLVGPVVMALAIAVLRLYAAETRARRTVLVSPAAS